MPPTTTTWASTHSNSLRSNATVTVKYAFVKQPDSLLLFELGYQAEVVAASPMLTTATFTTSDATKFVLTSKMSGYHPQSEVAFVYLQEP